MFHNFKFCSKVVQNSICLKLFSLTQRTIFLPVHFKFIFVKEPTLSLPISLSSSLTAKIIFLETNSWMIFNVHQRLPSIFAALVLVVFTVSESSNRGKHQIAKENHKFIRGYIIGFVFLGSEFGTTELQRSLGNYKYIMAVIVFATLQNLT